MRIKSTPAELAKRRLDECLELLTVRMGDGSLWQTERWRVEGIILNGSHPTIRRRRVITPTEGARRFAAGYIFDREADRWRSPLYLENLARMKQPKGVITDEIRASRAASSLAREIEAEARAARATARRAAVETAAQLQRERRQKERALRQEAKRLALA